jgi:alanine dehydrogenase
MIIGVPKEIKNHEYRVALTPEACHELTAAGHRVLIQHHAGSAIGFEDEEYIAAGAEIEASEKTIFRHADMIVKVKEPQSAECHMLRENQVLFTYLHLAPDPAQTNDLIKSGATCIAYETVTDRNGHLPLLAPMSEVAGRMSIQAGAHCLEKSQGGRGLLLGGVPGVEPATVVILGAGVVGTNAAQMAVGLGARVVIIDKSIEALRRIDVQFGSKATTVYSTTAAIKYWACQADLVIGGVLIPGAAAPKLITRELLKQMKSNSAIVDVAIDQGGCFETSKPTTHDDPTFVEEGIVHYCVANMPGAVARTSTQSLNNATLPFVMQLANKGAKQALQDNHHLLQGLNIAGHKLTCPSVGQAQERPSLTPEQGLELIK